MNNAGRGAAVHFGQATDEVWDEDLQLKLHGAIRCSRAAIPRLQAAGGGCIINITTVGGKAPAAGSVPTTVSRAAGIALTKAMSKDFAGDGIRVNTVMLGSIRSMQWERRWQRERPDLSLGEYYAEAGRAIPLGRTGRAEEVGNLIAFLASPRAAYVTGAAVAIDGGAGHAI
jgi:NAD(P)-dependent dehydrogenase (short-subunit alcohol dehydrogenase family)